MASARATLMLIRRSRELLIVRTLQDAAAALEEGSTEKALALPDVAQRVDAELVLSRGGALQASSAPVLADLGLVDWLVPPDAFKRLALRDYLEVTGKQEDTPQPVLVGYHLLRQAEPLEISILASPQLLSDPALSGREEDLSIAVLVAAVLGIVAALVLSGLPVHSFTFRGFPPRKPGPPRRTAARRRPGFGAACRESRG